MPGQDTNKKIFSLSSNPKVMHFLSHPTSIWLALRDNQCAETLKV